MQRNHNHISDLTLSYLYNLNTVTKVGQKRVGFPQPDKNLKLPKPVGAVAAEGKKEEDNEGEKRKKRQDR